jgi:GT2 family glycosyltransferase
MVVSILIPCFNSERWLSAAIVSALNQKNCKVEVIIADDASIDQSVDIIRTFGDKVNLISGPHRGGNAVRNILLENATGEWVQFLDADDELSPEKISTQLQYVDNNVDAVYGSVTLQWWKDESLINSMVSEPSRELDLYSHWFNWQLAQTGSVLWRASSLRKIGGWNESATCCQDNELTLRALKHGLRFVQSNDAGAIYRIWSDQTVCRRDPSMLIKVKTSLIDEMILWLREHNKLTQSHLEIAGKACFEMARSLYQIDSIDAKKYAIDRVAQNVFNFRRAPFHFKVLMSLFGFSVTENLASLARRATVQR